MARYQATSAMPDSTATSSSISSAGSALRDASFWNADFFYPFPLTIAFSDNFLGNAFVYALFRAVGFAREDAFRLWYVAGFVVNFAAADYALVRFRYSRFAAALGAFLFTFGLPIMAQEEPRSAPLPLRGSTRGSCPGGIQVATAIATALARSILDHLAVLLLDLYGLLPDPASSVPLPQSRAGS